MDNYAWAAGRDFVNGILEKAKNANIELEGPADTEYGWGWCPTTSFWVGERRVHLSCELFGQHRNFVEIADRSVKRVQRAYVDNDEIQWEIIRLFLGEQCAFEDLPQLDWVSDNLDIDKFIPHPPSVPFPGNIASLIKDMKDAGAQPWAPDSDND